MTTALEISSTPVRAEIQSTCFVCGPTHPSGLHLRFEFNSDGLAIARWIPSSRWEGFRGIIHGGIVSTVLDEAMSKAVAALRCEALTAELRIRLHHPVKPGVEYRIRGWVADRKRRRIRTEAVLEGPSGEEYAHAWGTFLTLFGNEQGHIEAATAEDPR